MEFVRKNIFRIFLIFSIYIFSFSAFSNLGGTDIQNFNPTSSGLDFVTVHSARTLKPYELNFGGFFNYVTNSLSYSKLSRTPNTQEFGDPNDTILYSNLHFGVGILQGWEMGLNIGSTNSQQISGESNFLFFYDVKGLNDIRLNSKIRFFEKEDLRLAVFGSVDFERTKENPFSGEDYGPAFNLEAVGDFKINPDLLFAVNFGYRIRQEGSTISNSGVVPISDQVIYSSAISYTTDNKGSAVIGEIYGGLPVEETIISSDRETDSLELLVGYRHSGIGKFNFHGGLGTGVYRGLGSPDFRIYVGLNWKTDQIARAVGFRKEEIPVRETPVQEPPTQEISPLKKGEIDDTTNLSIKKEVGGELPEKIDGNHPEKPMEKKSAIPQTPKVDDIREMNDDPKGVFDEDY